MHKPGGLYVSVADHAQYDACAAAGWAALPEGHVEQPVEVSYAEAIKTDEKPKKGKK